MGDFESVMQKWPTLEVPSEVNSEPNRVQPVANVSSDREELILNGAFLYLTPLESSLLSKYEYVEYFLGTILSQWDSKTKVEQMSDTDP